MNKGLTNSTLFLCISTCPHRHALLAHSHRTADTNTQCGVPFVLLIRVLSEPSIERMWSSTLSLLVEVKVTDDNTF